MSETALVQSCMRILQMYGCVVWRQNQGSARKGGFYVKFTYGMDGISDLIGLMPGGRFIAVECKVGKNKTSDEQTEFLKRVNAAGGLGLVVYDSMELLKAMQALRK